MEDYNNILKNRLDDIEKLISVPDFFREIAVNHLSNLKTEAKQQLIIVKIDNTIKTINNIQSDSLRTQFSLIYGQCCILAVSAIEDLLKDIFKKESYKKLGDISSENKAAVKMNLEDFLHVFESDKDFKNEVGELILNSKKYNFQDLKNTKEAFQKYCMVDLNFSNELQQKIIFYQQIRHVIAHKNSIVDQTFLDRTAKMNANIKSYSINDLVELDSNDWEELRGTLEKYIKEISNAL